MSLELYFLSKCHLTNHREGKIKYIGLSGVSSNTLRRACKIAHVAAVQMEYSPFVLDIEGTTGTNLLDTCRELGVAVVCYSPLGRGLLTGAFTSRDSITGPSDLRATQFPRFSEENIEENAKIVNQFKILADQKGCTSSQLAIAWLLKQGENIIPIPGTKKITNMESNWASLDVHLTDADEGEVRNFVESAEILGSRETAAGTAFAYVDTKEEVLN
jgi:aryl-alcohol dehydrogenase-like predicted oxidoreductase